MRAAQMHLGAWEGSGPGHRAIEPQAAGGRRVVIVDRPGSVQSELRMGEIGISRTSDRYFPAIVMGAMLGGVFGSRLNLRLREELGYTYGARAGFDARRAPGPFSAAAAALTLPDSWGGGEVSISDLLLSKDGLRLGGAGRRFDIVRRPLGPARRSGL